MAANSVIISDASSEKKCQGILTESIVTVKRTKEIRNNDYRTTLSSNARAQATIRSVNDVRMQIGDYLNIDSENFQMITKTLNQTDNELSEGMSKRYVGRA
ncbi:MAG: TIGR04197 family type VII secretion effector [Lachnospiraceae bacterium]|jgi:type VII secretion effector (TIGR04197 family)|nr:TIGR04197 family type VII secretion effector [Lachnospiraceae bacterium]